jgi:hypothetical protein
LTPLQREYNRHTGKEGRDVREEFYTTLTRKKKYHGKTGLSAKLLNTSLCILLYNQ